MAVSKVEVPDDYVPKDYDDLCRTYKPFVVRLVTRYNQVNTNFDDLCQHVWFKIIENKVIEKYHRSGPGLPQQVTALQACALLQITWSQWKMIVWRGLRGDDRFADDLRVPAALSAQVFERDQGVCHCCGSDMARFQEAMRATKARAKISAKKAKGEPTEAWQRWRNTCEAIEAKGVSSKRRIFWVVESIRDASPDNSIDDLRTACLFCVHRKGAGSPAIRRKSEWAPTPISGGWASKKAMYSMADVERVKAQREGSKRAKIHGEIDPNAVVVATPSKNRFKLYLAKTVHNIYANWCRTRSRRYKELYPAPHEDGQAWESFLEDSTSARPDTLVELYQAVKKIGAKSGGRQDEVLALLGEGFSLTEVVQKLSLHKSLLRAVTR